MISQRIIVVTIAASLSITAQASVRAIESVVPIKVNCPAGEAPQLPNRVWVTYKDGYSEWRQVRWMNAPLSTEQAEADIALHPVGSNYELKGYIIGDETTDNGYPITAKIKVGGT